MKIRSVTPFLADLGGAKNLLFVKVETDGGPHGWGECYTQADRDRSIVALVDKYDATFCTLRDDVIANDVVAAVTGVGPLGAQHQATSLPTEREGPSNARGTCPTGRRQTMFSSSWWRISPASASLQKSTTRSASAKGASAMASRSRLVCESVLIPQVSCG